MKKSLLVFAFIAFVLSFYSCQKETMTVDNGRMVFTAYIDNTFETKTTISNDRKVFWVDNDQISINGITFNAIPKSDPSKADFTKVSGDDPTGPYYAYYPSSLFDGKEAILPKTISFSPTHPFSNTPMYAESETNTLSFKNICSVLAITVNNANFPSIKSIKVSSSNRAMSGAFTVSEGTTAVLSDATTVANSIILSCETAVPTAPDGTVFYIAIPAQTYKNLKIELSADGINYTKSMTTNKDVEIETKVNTVYPIAFKEDPSSSVTVQVSEIHPNRLALRIEKSSNTSYFYLYEGNGMEGTRTKYTSSKTITFDFLEQGTTYYYTIAPYDEDNQLGKVEVVSAKTSTLSYSSYFYYEGDYHQFKSATMSKETLGNSNWKNLRLNTSNGLCFVKFSYCVPYTESLSSNWSDGNYTIKSSGNFYDYIGYFNDGSTGLQYTEGTMTIKTVNKVKIITFTLYDERYRKLVGYFYGLK